MNPATTVPAAAMDLALEVVAAVEQALAELEPLTLALQPVPSDQVMVERAQKGDWLGHGMEVELDDIEFDLDVSRGQIRDIKPHILAKLRAQFEMAEPLVPLHAVLVAADAAGVKGAWHLVLSWHVCVQLCLQ